MPGEKPSKGEYETFDSGGGPTIPDKDNYDNVDANPSDHGVEQGAVPEVPQN